jgi:hypothetical protein
MSDPIDITDCFDDCDEQQQSDMVLVAVNAYMQFIASEVLRPFQIIEMWAEIERLLAECEVIPQAASRRYCQAMKKATLQIREILESAE